MARLTYGSVVAALVALVAGFFVRTSNLPLIISIGFSALATLLILFGWGRRLRAETQAQEAEPQVEDVDFIDLGADEDETHPVRTRLAARREERARRARGLEGELRAEMTDEMPALEEFAATPRRSRKKAKRRAPRPRQGYVALEADLEDLPDPADFVAAPTKPKAKPPAKAKPARKPKPAPKAKAKPAPKRSAAPKRGPEVVVVPGRGRYHRASCRFADRPEATTLSVVAARRRGYVACSVCNPDDE